MATKTWKIGEYARGGIITVQVNKTGVIIIGKDWDFSAGSNKGSNQSNAVEFYRMNVKFSESDMQNMISETLCWLTTHYYAGQIMEWIKSKAPSGVRFTYPLV